MCTSRSSVSIRGKISRTIPRLIFNRSRNPRAESHGITLSGRVASRLQDPSSSLVFEVTLIPVQTSTLLDPLEPYQPAQGACRSPTRKSGHQQLRIVLVVHHAGLDGCSRATPVHVKRVYAGCAEARCRSTARSHPRSRRISLEMDCNANEIVPADSRGACRRVVSFHMPYPRFSSLSPLLVYRFSYFHGKELLSHLSRSKTADLPLHVNVPCSLFLQSQGL